MNTPKLKIVSVKNEATNFNINFSVLELERLWEYLRIKLVKINPRLKVRATFNILNIARFLPVKFVNM